MDIPKVMIRLYIGRLLRRHLQLCWAAALTSPTLLDRRIRWSWQGALATPNSVAANKKSEIIFRCGLNNTDFVLYMLVFIFIRWVEFRNI